MTQSLVKIKSMTFGYHIDKPIMQDISMELEEGIITGILGENGAGKTTLFDILSGNIRVESGSMEWSIEPSQISYLQQMITLPPALNVSEVVEMIACFHRVSRRDIDRLIERYWPNGLIERYEKIKDRRVGVCSYGEKRSVVLCATLAFGYDKKLFILDEPTAGVDVQHRYLIWQLMQEMKKERKTFVVSSHLIDEIGKNTDGFYLLHHQKLQSFAAVDQFCTQFGGETAEDAFVNATVLA